jgi:ketosteroid isomerase-like protein
MSQENVELVRRTIDLINAKKIDQAMDGAHTNVEMDWSNSRSPLKGVYQGRPEVLKFWTTFVDAWEAMRWEPEEIIEVDDARLIVVNRFRMRGRGSGVDVEVTGAHLWTIAAGKVQGVKLFQSKADALEAAGLSE